MNLSLAALALAASVGLASTAEGEDFVEATKATGDALDAFYGTCLNSVFEISVALPFIEALGWEEIDEATMSMLAPPEPQEFLKGWVATAPDDNPEDGSLPFFLVFGRPADKTVKIETCTTFFRFVDPVEFTDVFIFETSAREIDRETQPGQIIRVFDLPDLEGVVVSLSYGSRPDSRDIIASTMHFEGASPFK